MKKRFVLTVLFVVLTAFAYAQASDTASVTLTGQVAVTVAVTVTPTNNTDLPLTTDVSSRSVAVVNEYSNNRDGYTVSITSAQNWALAGAANGDRLSYTATYDGVPVPTGAATAEVTNVNDRTGSQGDASGIDKVLAISYAAADANLYNDDYADTLTFTITAK